MQNAVQVKIVGNGIVNPGTYTLNEDSEVIDLVRTAGGLEPGAIRAGIDWHQQVFEGLTLTVPTRETLKSVRSGTEVLSNEDLIRFRQYEPPESDTNLININEARAAELQTLPGIGPVLSGRIIKYRSDHGPFRSTKDLKRILGLGQKTYQRIRSRVTIR